MAKPKLANERKETMKEKGPEKLLFLGVLVTAIGLSGIHWSIGIIWLGLWLILFAVAAYATRNERSKS